MLRLLLLSLACLLVACGQKGPLYLPTTPAVMPPATVEAPAPAQDNNQNTSPAAVPQP